jgi:hypothetical protein
MRTRGVKGLCIAVLFVAFVLWQCIADYEFRLRLVVCAGAAVLAVQAFYSARHRWTMRFLLTALFFNPAIPVVPPANRLGPVAIVLATAAVAAPLTKLKPQPMLSIPSITDCNRGSESL